MPRFSIRNGDMLRDTRTGLTYVAQSEVFTKRYMDAQDWEMVEHGMGEFAGLYESALRVLNIKDGISTIIRMGHWRKHLENLTAIGEGQTINKTIEMDERRIV
jgi:uncharacterized protein with NAD-binding domain and iron-sulfur cluster